jgi:GT2 family glycosyltransferase
MISVIIPTYKNVDQIKNNLAHNLPHLKGCEVIVVNDDPSASIKEELKVFDITLIENTKNLGFSGAVDAGVSAASNPFLLLLNSDVLLQDESYRSAVETLKIDQMFAVSFAQKEKDGSIVGKNELFWARGMLFHRKAADLTKGENGWAEGGACLMRKDVFEKLEGFDTIFSPFYWEDIDLSYRAKKLGYRILFDPSIEVIHHHESTIGKYFKKKKISKIAYRNQFYFIWKNITDHSLFFRHELLLPLNVIYYLLKGQHGFAGGLFEALKHTKRVAKARKKSYAMGIVSDRKILSLR